MKKFFTLQRFAKKVNLTKKADTYSNSASSRIIYGLAGNDSIYNTADKVTVSGGKGKDTLTTAGVSYVSLSGDVGDDSLSIAYSSSGSVSMANSYYVTLSGGAGNDSLNTGDASYSSVNGGSGNDSIYGAGDYSTISGGAGNDTVRNGGDSSSISGGIGNDSIYSSGNYSAVDGGAGNDTITNSYGYNSSISGGSGNDYISSSNSSSTYYSSVSSGSYYITLNGGKGDDIINLSGGNQILQYASGDGDDIVLGFNSDDTLHITKGKYSVKTDENDVIVTVGKGAVTLKGMAGQKISIKNSSGKTTKKTYGSSGLFAEDNFVENELESIIENKSPAALEDFKTSDATNLAAKTSLTSGIDYDKN